MPAGASKKREREYEKLKKKFKRSGRYEGREKEVASRIVNKQRAQYGETKGAEERRAKGEATDRNAPIQDYKTLTVDEVLKRSRKKSDKDLRKIRKWEAEHKNRKTLLDSLDRQLEH
ncbi:MAG: hypothetical protein J5J00_06565 [Deltaproteobacteria bacterium]|nr:hypothetical protein [Deltaproteobacteria bacterium]